jgi:hypothetical protein
MTAKDRMVHEILKGMIEDDEGEKSFRRDPDIEAHLLRDALSTFSRKAELRVGMVVKFKPAMAKYQATPNGLFIVVDLLQSPVCGEVNEGKRADYADMIAGRLDDDGDLITFYADSRLFEPADEARQLLRRRPTGINQL